jgi:hypothetical protein
MTLALGVVILALAFAFGATVIVMHEVQSTRRDALLQPFELEIQMFHLYSPPFCLTVNKSDTVACFVHTARVCLAPLGHAAV